MSTITTTVSSINTEASTPSVVTLNLTLPTLTQSVRKKVNDLVLAMHAQELFLETHLKEINAWKSEFDRSYAVDLTSDQNCEKCCYALCFLICEIIRPVMTKETNVAKQEKLFIFEEESHNILTLILSDESQTSDDLIQDYKNSSDCAELFSKSLEKIEALFQNKIVFLYSTANKINEDLLLKFENLKEGLRKINASRIEKSQEVNERLDKLTEKVDQIYKDLKKNVQKAGDVATQLTDQQKSFDQMIQEASNLLGRLK